MTRDRTNNCSFRQKLDPISKNILRRQNPLELVFENISTFDAENPIVGSLLREIDIKKKKSDSGFIKSLPSHPGKEFEIKKRLDALRNIKNNDNFNNNNNSGPPPPPSAGTNIDFLSKYGLDKPPPSLPAIEDFIDNGPPPPPPSSGTNISFNNTPFVPPKPHFDITNNPFVLPNIGTNGKIGNDLFSSVAAMAGPREQEKTEKNEIYDFLYELPDTGMPHLELGDKLADILGAEGEDLFDVNAPPTKKEEKDEILKKVIEEYDIPGMKDTMDETGQVPESIYFFYGGDSQNFVDALEFIGLSPINREFAAFLLSDLGRQVMTQNKLSIHVESGDIFYNNHNMEENFYSFLLSQQNDEAVYVPKNFSYSDTFEKYITSFLQLFSIDDQEKFNLLAFKNSKYLFYRFNDFVKMYGNPRYKLLHTRKMIDTVGQQKVEQKNNQFLIEKVILGVEFENAYQKEKKPEILEIIEGNYKVARRVYQYLYFDIIHLFLEYVKSMDSYEIQDIEEDMKVNGWGTVEKISEINDSIRMLNLFQDFYTSTGRLPAFNGLLVVPDGDTSENSNKVNMKNLYDLFKNTKSHGLVSLPFLGLLLHFFESEKDLYLIKNATTELYKNLSYMTLSGARNLEFEAVSDFIARLSELMMITLT